MPDRIQAEMLRRWATDCAARAAHADIDEEQRARLLKMKEALLDLATRQDWLERDPPADGDASQQRGQQGAQDRAQDRKQDRPQEPLQESLQEPSQDNRPHRLGATG